MTAADVFVVPLPYLRPPLSLNQRLHWAAKAIKTQDIRKAVAVLARQHRTFVGGRVTWPVKPPVTVELVWTVTDRRHRDTDNPVPTLKACIDGLRDSGLLRDDSSEYVPWSRTRIVLGAKAGLRLEIREWRQEAAA